MHLVTFERSTTHTAQDKTGALNDAVMGFESLEPVRPGSRRLGAVIPTGSYAGWLVDLNRALAIKLAYDDVGAPEVEADWMVPSDMLSLLRLGPAALKAAKMALAFAIDTLECYNAPDFLRAGAVEPAGRVKLCAPLSRPGKIIGALDGNLALGTSGLEDSAAPRLFLKAPSAVIGPEDEISLPAGARRVCFRGALAAVIGARTRNVAVATALDRVAGYCVANDVWSPDLEDESIGRSCDTFAPLGPWLVTTDEIPDPAGLGVRSVVAGDVAQFSSTKEMRFSVAQIIAHASTIMVLEAGDVILVEAPSGIEAPGKPKRWIRDGDFIEIEIESLGRLRNYVTSAKSD
jgi:2-keto-4-pentenoate hydratase/2-oxohepta-3-ene-1,7-dioic acid hydratase in catechol pathway